MRGIRPVHRPGVLLEEGWACCSGGQAKGISADW